MNMLHKAMTIAGSDASGGAGMEADLKTFQELDVYGMTALTVIVAQNPHKDWFGRCGKTNRNDCRRYRYRCYENGDAGQFRAG